MPYVLHSNGSRTKLRETFDRVAPLYDAMRPSYPNAVFHDIVAISGVSASSSILEIGCGTGLATQAFASTGFSIHALELSDNMAAMARRRLAPFENIKLEVADFDSWTTISRFDLAYAATAFHWLDPATREQRIAALLSPGGWLAVWSNHHVRNGSDAFQEEARRIYIEEAPELSKRVTPLPSPAEALEAMQDQLSLKFFAEPILRIHVWTHHYSAADYIQMLSTHSDHQLLSPERRARLFDRLTNLIHSSFGGSVIKDHATVLRMARKRS